MIFRVIYDRIDDETPTRPVVSLTTAGEAFGGFGLGAVGKTSDALYTTYTSQEQYAALRTDAITIHANWQITDNQKLAFVFGDRETDELARQEFDGVAADLFWTDRPTEENQTSYELRLESDWSDSLRSTVGVFYWDGDYTLQQNTALFNIVNPLMGGAGKDSGNISIADRYAVNYTASPLYSQTVETTAVFGQVDWDLTEQLMVSVGGRWLDEEKNACMTVSGYPVNPLQTTSWTTCRICGHTPMWLATIRHWTPIHFWLVERWQRDPGAKTAPHGLPQSTMIHSMVALPLTISRQGWGRNIPLIPVWPT